MSNPQILTWYTSCSKNSIPPRERIPLGILFKTEDSLTVRDLRGAGAHYEAGVLGKGCPATCITFDPRKSENGVGYFTGGPTMPGATSQCYRPQYHYASLDALLKDGIKRRSTP